MRIIRSHMREIFIYTAMTLGGLVVDLGVANLFAYLFAWPLVISGIFGLIAGTITNYFIHLNITFKSRNLNHSWKGFWKYVQTCLLGAGVRVGILGLFSLFSNIAPLVALIIATGLSFTVNYLLSRFYVFQSPDK
jgi:putative flippase GtrA